MCVSYLLPASTLAFDKGGVAVRSAEHCDIGPLSPGSAAAVDPVARRRPIFRSETDRRKHDWPTCAMFDGRVFFNVQCVISLCLFFVVEGMCL